MLACFSSSRGFFGLAFLDSVSDHPEVIIILQKIVCDTSFRLLAVLAMFVFTVGTVQCHCVLGGVCM